MFLTEESFNNSLEYIKIFLYNLQRVIFWARYILLYLIGGIIALDQIRIILYYHKIFIVISLVTALLLTLILLPKITSSQYSALYENYLKDKDNSNIIHYIKVKLNFWVQYCYDVTVGFTLATHMLALYCPQVAVIIMRTYSPVILIMVAFLFYGFAILNEPQYQHKIAVNRALAKHYNANRTLKHTVFNKKYLNISAVLSSVVFFGLNKFLFGRALVFYLWSPPTILAAIILGVGGMLANLGWTRRCWNAIEATAMGFCTTYTVTLLGKIVYLAFYDSMLAAGSTANFIILAMPSVPYVPILILFACALGLAYGFSYHKDLSQEHKALTVLKDKGILIKTYKGLSSKLDLSGDNMAKLGEMLSEYAGDNNGYEKVPVNEGYEHAKPPESMK